MKPERRFHDLLYRLFRNIGGIPIVLHRKFSIFHHFTKKMGVLLPPIRRDMMIDA